MRDEERISKIKRAKTRQELDQALSGYQAQVLGVYPVLQGNYAFNLALERKQYFHALCDIKRAARGVWGDGYLEVIRVLENAADKQFVVDDV